MTWPCELHGMSLETLREKSIQSMAVHVSPCGSFSQTLGTQVASRAAIFLFFGLSATAATKLVLYHAITDTSAKYPDGRPCPRPGRPEDSRPIPCTADSNCILNVPFEPGTCNSAPVSCLNTTPPALPGKVCRSPVPGGSVCGTWIEEPMLEPKGDDVSQFWPVGAERSLQMDLFSTDLFSIELLCREDQ